MDRGGRLTRFNKKFAGFREILSRDFAAQIFAKGGPIRAAFFVLA